MDRREEIAKTIGRHLESIRDLEDAGILPAHQANKCKKLAVAMLIDAAERLHRKEVIEKMNKDLMAKRLVELRGVKTRRGVAEEIGIHENALYLYETGKSVPTAEVMKKLADYYGKTVDEIFFAD